MGAIARIAWVRLKGPICPIFFIVVYIPHKFRDVTPQAADTINELAALLKTIPKNDCVVITGDFNCQLRRNVPGCTGKWCMTKKNEQQGHDQEILDLMRANDLFAVDTRFKPKAKQWSAKKRTCNATYLPKHIERRPTKLDYFLVTNRWQGMVTNSSTKWGAAQHRFGKKFDHSLLSIEWQWRIKDTKRIPSPDFENMTPAKWAEFDTRLAHRLSQLPHAVERSPAEMGAHYERMAGCVRDTVSDTAPKKNPLKYNGRKVSAKTKRLYDLRVRDFASGRKITKDDRQAWNRTLNKAAMADYKNWVENWACKMEAADEKGDIKTVPQGARALAGKSKSFKSTQPTKNKQGNLIQSEEELGELW